MTISIKNKDLKALAGEIWSNGESYVLDGSELLRKLQAALREAPKGLHDRISLELSDDEAEKLSEAAENIGVNFQNED